MTCHQAARTGFVDQKIACSHQTQHGHVVCSRQDYIVQTRPVATTRSQSQASTRESGSAYALHEWHPVSLEVTGALIMPEFLADPTRLQTRPGGNVLANLRPAGTKSLDKW
jgi:hypothetical protein